MASRLAASTTTPVDAYMIFVFRYCPAVFYCIPITHFTPEQFKAIQSPFMNTLLHKLWINCHVKRAVVWGPKKYGGLELAHMETEQLAQATETIVGHVRASIPTGLTFIITCGAYQMYLGLQRPFFLSTLDLCLHRPSHCNSYITYLWESLHCYDGLLFFKEMWTPPEAPTPCIMDLVIQAQQDNKGSVSNIRDENIRLANTCRIWMRALYIGDLLTPTGYFHEDFLTGAKQCNTDLAFPHQTRLPDWVWKVWRQVLLQAYGQWENGKLRYLQQDHCREMPSGMCRWIEEQTEPDSQHRWNWKLCLAWQKQLFFTKTTPFTQRYDKRFGMQCWHSHCRIIYNRKKNGTMTLLMLLTSEHLNHAWTNWQYMKESI